MSSRVGSSVSKLYRIPPTRRRSATLEVEDSDGRRWSPVERDGADRNRGAEVGVAPCQPEAVTGEWRWLVVEVGAGAHLAR